MSNEGLIACHECDLLQRSVAVAPGAAIRCARCGATLARRPRHGIDRSLPLFAAAAILFLVANAFPIVTLQLQGDETDATLLRAARVMYDEHRPDVALLVLLTGVLAPAMQIGTALYVLVALRLRRVPPGFAGAFRLFRQCQRPRQDPDGNQRRRESRIRVPQVEQRTYPRPRSERKHPA